MDLRQSKVALCVAAHPDDEVLGAGATMARLVDHGCEVHVLILGEGVGARYKNDDRPDQEVADVAGQAKRAAEVLGTNLHQLDFPDNRFDRLDTLDVVQAIEAVAGEIVPDLVLTHHAGDLNVDHRVSCNAVLTALRPLPGARARAILGFETLSSTEWGAGANNQVFRPNWFEDVEQGLQRKLEAMEAYAHELEEWPHPRSLEGIRVAARKWGMTVGREAAEPFELLRLVSGSS